MRTRAPKAAGSIEGECLAPGSLFQFLAQRLPEIATEEVVGGIFSETRGRGSTPPEHLVAILMLRYFEKVSYEVASDRTRYDLRWKAVLGRQPSELGPVVSDTTLNDFGLLRLICGREKRREGRGLVEPGLWNAWKAA